MEEKKYDIITLGRSSIDLYSQNIGVPFNEIKGFDAFVEDPQEFFVCLL